MSAHNLIIDIWRPSATRIGKTLQPNFFGISAVSNSTASYTCKSAHLLERMSSQDQALPQDLVEQYRTSDDDGREKIFAGLFKSHHTGHNTPPNGATASIEGLLLTLMSQSSTGEDDFDLETAFQELYSGMQIFCLACPSSLDYAWDSTINFINMLKGNELANEHNAHHLAIDGLETWIAENASGDPCSMSDDENPTRPTDPSILRISDTLWDQGAAKQLSKLASNRLKRRDNIVNKVIQARALRDGYASTSSTNFMGALELRFIEVAFMRSKGELLFNGHYQSSADVIAATFLLRGCARSLLDYLPEEGFTFGESMYIPPLKAGKEGKEERLQGWKEALKYFVISCGEQRSENDFALACYAGMALENLSNPRDETSADLFLWANIAL